MNGFQEEEQEQEQHIDCIDLAIKKTSNIISKFNDDFSEDFSEVLHISVGQKIKILETRPDFLTFSAKAHNRF